MSQTYQELLINETRALELTVRDQDGNEFAPSAAYVEIQDEEGNTVVDEQLVQTYGNKVITLVGTATTTTPGTYYVIWKIQRYQYTYYHVTKLLVSKLL